MTTTQPLPTTTRDIGGIGHSVKRHEDDRLLQGQGNFLDDHVLPGMLHMAILRSPVPHARINSIDTSAAAALDGVVAVVTGELLAQYNLAWMPTLSGDTQAVLATDKVRFQGQEVAAVVATDPYIAEDALELIDVDYELLPVITSPQQSLEAGAVLIRDLRIARRSAVKIAKRSDLAISVIDADALAASPIEAGLGLRAAAGLPMQLTPFISPRIRRATAALTSISEADLESLADDLAPLRKALGEFGRG